MTKHMRVLVVDDNAANVKYFVGVLETAGHVVEVEVDGTAGRDRALREAFDLIILDIQLAGMSGDAPCREPRAAVLACAIGAALLTPRIASSERNRCYAATLVAAILAIPYFMLRFADDLSQVPRRVLPAALVGWVVVPAPFVVVPTPPPVWLTLAITLYFAVFAGLAGVFVAREAIRSRGVSRRRLQALALGSLLLGAV